MEIIPKVLKTIGSVISVEVYQVAGGTEDTYEFNIIYKIVPSNLKHKILSKMNKNLLIYFVVNLFMKISK